MPTIKTVHIITYCDNLDLIYGSLLVFDSVRLAFPNAKIVVSENSNLSEAKSLVWDRAKAVEAFYIDVPLGFSHHDVLSSIFTVEEDAFAIVDPDVIFWDRFDYVSDFLIEGRYLPTFKDPYTKCLTKERLHTSMIKVGDPQRLRKEIEDVRENFFEWDPFKPFMYRNKNLWERSDTLASLYSVFKNDCYKFTESELNSYDHLFCGSHLPRVIDNLGNWKDIFVFSHEKAKTSNCTDLKGLWRKQDLFFQEHKN